ncbi:unnamed protein product, partial [marine sediment metagenome]
GNGNLDIGYTGTVSFSSTDSGAVLPSNYTFTAFDRGFHHFTATLNTEGLQTITVNDGPRSGKSNVIEVTAGMPANNIFFGDIHGHSWFSDGMIWIDDHYIYARDVAGLDFAAVTDHSEAVYNFTADLVVPYVNRYNDPPNFVTFHANEWTRAQTYGHMNPLFLYENEFMITPYTTYKTPTELWDALAGLEVITPPHH